MLDSFLSRIGAVAGGVALLVVAATVPLGRWLVPVIGLAMVLIVGGLLAVILQAGKSAWKWRRRRMVGLRAPDLDVVPTGGPSQDLRLMITNRGGKADFQGTASIVATRNYQNRPRQGSYTLMWLGRGTNTISLDQGQSEALLVARWKIHDGPSPRLAEVDIVECNGSVEAEWDGFRWNMMPAEQLPEFDIDVTIVGSGLSDSFKRSYTLRPSDWDGPLELIRR